MDGVSVTQRCLLSRRSEHGMQASRVESKTTIKNPFRRFTTMVDCSALYSWLLSIVLTEFFQSLVDPRDLSRIR